MFETKFYFSDAVGNQDSITIGFDTLANDVFNPQFGEVKITKPFDSLFEVRAVHNLDFNWGQNDFVMTKKIVSGVEEAINLPNCYGAGAVLFLINGKHQPFKISWNHQVFENLFCLKPSFLTPDHLFELIWPWDWLELPNRRWACLSKADDFDVFLGNEFLSPPAEYPYATVQPIEGQMPDSVFGVVIHFVSDLPFSPCQFDVNSTASIFTPNKSAIVDVFPNPTSAQVVVKRAQLIGKLEARVFSSTGNQVLRFQMNENETTFSLAGQPAGLYVLSIGNGTTNAIQKIIKRE